MKVPSLIRFLANKAPDFEKVVSTASSIPNLRKKHIYGVVPEFKRIIKPNRNNPVGTVDKVTSSERLRQINLIKNIRQNNPSYSVGPIEFLLGVGFFLTVMPLLIVALDGAFFFILMPLYWLFVLFLIFF